MAAAKPLPPLTPGDIARFRSRLVPQPNGCLLWKGNRFVNGYGRFKVRGRELKSHRVAYFLATGKDPGDALVCHTCDTPPCCEASHLFDGTPAVNSADMKAKGRQNTPSGVRHGTKTHPDRHAKGDDSVLAKLTAANIDAIARRYLAGGISHAELAREYGVTRETVSQALRGKNWGHLSLNRDAIAAVGERNRHPRGERAANVKLTEAQVREALTRIAAGESVQRLSGELGVSRELLYAIRAGRAWKHVTHPH